MKLAQKRISSAPVASAPKGPQKYKVIFIFLGLVLVAVFGERLLRSSPVAEEAAERAPVVVDTEAVVTAVRPEPEINFDESELNEKNLKSIEQVVVTQAVTAAKGLLSGQSGGRVVDLVPSSKSRLVKFSDRELGIIEVTLTPSVAAAGGDAPIDPVYFTRIFGFVNEHPVSISCVRPSGRPVSILSGECGLRIAEVFQLDLQ